MDISFESTWTLLVWLNSACGLFSFKENSIKARKQKIYQLYYCLIYFVLIFMIISGSIIYKDELVFVAICYISGFSLTFVGLSFFEMQRNQAEFEEIFDWCRLIYDISQYKPAIRRKILMKLENLQKKSLRMIKSCLILSLSEYLLVYIIFPILAVFLPEHIYPKYTTTLPFVFPIKNRDNWTVYSLTVMVQAMSIFHVFLHFVYSFFIFFTISIHFVGFLDVILEVVDNFKCSLLIEKDIDKNKRIKNVIGAILNELCEENSKENRLSFNEHIKELADMISSLML